MASGCRVQPTRRRRRYEHQVVATSKQDTAASPKPGITADQSGGYMRWAGGRVVPHLRSQTGTHMRRAIKVLLLILLLLLAIASAGIITTLLIIEWPRAASARVDVAERTSEPRSAKARPATAPQGDGSGSRRYWLRQ